MYALTYYSRSLLLLVTRIYSVDSSICVNRQLLLYPTITRILENWLLYLKSPKVYQMTHVLSSNNYDGYWHISSRVRHGPYVKFPIVLA